MKKWTLLAVTGIVVVLVLVTILHFQTQLFPPPHPRTVLHGSLFVSDAGQSHGGFEYNAEWNTTLDVEGSTGVLDFTLYVGLGDALEKHRYMVSDFVMDEDRINMKVEGQAVILVWAENDLVWNHRYDRYYIASWGSDAPPDEIRGSISPTIFSGLADSYYVEFRLR